MSNQTCSHDCITSWPSVETESLESSLGMFVIFTLFVPIFVGTMAIFILRRRVQPILARSPKTAMVSAVGCLWVVWSISSENWDYGIPEYPCMYSHWRLWLALPMFLIPYPIRAWRLFLVYRLNWLKYTLQHLEELADSARDSETASSGGGSERKQSGREGKIRKLRSRHSSLIPSQFKLSEETQDDTRKAIKYKLLRQKQTTYIMIGFLALCVLGGLIRQLGVRSNYPPNTGCLVTTASAVSYITVVALILLLQVALMVGLRFINDEFFILQELQIVTLLWVLLLVPYLALSLVATRRCTAFTRFLTLSTLHGRGLNGEATPRCIPYEAAQYMLMLAVISSFLVTFTYPVALTIANGTRALTETTRPREFPDVRVLESLQRTLDNEAAAEAFKEFLVQEFSVENILFYNDVRRYQNMEDEEERVEQAAAIVQQYIGSAAQLEVNINHPVREALLETLQSSAPVDVFDDAFTAVFRLMEKDSFPRFLRSRTCKALVARIQAEVEQERQLQEAKMV